VAVEPEERVILARFGAPHGVSGEIRLKSFTADPVSVQDYGPLAAPDGRSFEIEAVRPIGGDMLVVRVRGVRDRNTAEALKGLELSVPRRRLPEPEVDDFYHADLVGLDVVGVDGARFGTVAAILNYGAGDILEIDRPGAAALLVPFTRAAVPEIDIGGGRLVIDPPAGVTEGSAEESE
jgi:16S rRNA processing protein RimM